MTKKNTGKTTTVAKKNNRAIKRSTYQSFRLNKPIKYSGPQLPSGWELLRSSGRVLWSHKKTLGGVLGVYGLLQVLLVQGVLASGAMEAGSTDGSRVATLSYLLSVVGRPDSAEAAAYQYILFIVGSLAFIWALRQLMAGKRISIKEAYYKGMYPFVPFVLILVVIGLQLIPLLIGAWLYNVVVTYGIVGSAIEQLFWLTVFFIFATGSLYMVCASVIALYIVTLPNMTPMKALRSARGLILHRRWVVLRKTIPFVLAAAIGIVIVMLPVILVVPVAAPAVLYMLTVAIVGAAHTYLYTMYRGLLDNE